MPNYIIGIHPEYTLIAGDLLVILEEAQDVFQETFTRFYQSAQKDRDMTNVPAFLLKIARNLCVNAKRREKPHVTFEEYMSSSTHPNNDKDELLNLIHIALDELSDEYKEMFILREYDGLSYQDISDLTGISLSNVKVRIYRSKQKD